MLPAALILLVSGVAILAVLSTAGRAIDKVAIESAIHTARSVVAAQERSIGKFAKDYTWWDAAFQKLVIERHSAFADDNIGTYAYETLEMSTAFVLDGRNNTLHAFIEGKAVQADPLRLFVGGLEGMIERARAAPADEPIAITGRLRLGDRVHVVGVSVFVPERIGNRKPETGLRSLLILSRAFDDVLLAQLSTDYRLSDLHAASPGATMPATHVVLESPDGTAVGALAWSPDLPGERLLREATIGVVAAFLAMAVLLWILLRRAQRLQIRIENDARTLQERNAALVESESTLRETKDSLERTGRSKSEFLANLSHELRTPLNAIVGFSEIVEGEAYGELGNPRYREYAGHIHRSARHMLDLVNDTLDLSRAEVGHLDLVEADVCIKQTVEICARMLTRLAEQAGITVTQAVEPALPRLHGDERRIRQMVLNLLSNAIKFTPTDGRVEVSARRMEDGGIAITVADSGIGIAEDDVEKALTPFMRLENGRTHMHDGAGIGLSLTRFLVELHGGRLTIDSQVDAGTRVSLHFPPTRTIAGRSVA